MFQFDLIKFRIIKFDAMSCDCDCDCDKSVACYVFYKKRSPTVTPSPGPTGVTTPEQPPPVAQITDLPLAQDTGDGRLLLVPTGYKKASRTDPTLNSLTDGTVDRPEPEENWTVDIIGPDSEIQHWNGTLYAFHQKYMAVEMGSVYGVVDRKMHERITFVLHFKVPEVTIGKKGTLKLEHMFDTRKFELSSVTLNMDLVMSAEGSLIPITLRNGLNELKITLITRIPISDFGYHVAPVITILPNQ